MFRLHRDMERLVGSSLYQRMMQIGALLYGEANPKKDTVGRESVFMPIRLQTPPYNIFDEYYVGNYDDIWVLVRNAQGGTFKSFQCSICAIQEPDGIKEVTSSGYLASASNPASAYTFPIQFEGTDLPFAVSATASKYVPNHSLLYPMDHICNYLVLLHRPYFKTLLSILWHSQDVVAIFNGNYGSDLYHGHVHLTPRETYNPATYLMKFYNSAKTGMTETQTELSADGKTGKIHIDEASSAFKGILFFSDSREILFQEIAPYVAIYFNPEIEREKLRSEERRVGKECRSRWSPYH